MIRQRPLPKTVACPSDSEQRWLAAGLCLVLAAITLVVFGQTAGFGFVNYDDDTYVYVNSLVEGGLSWKGLAWVFTHGDCLLYHPLTMLSLMADYQLHGLNAGGYHLTNVLLHTGSIILLFLVLRQMTGAVWRSAFVAAVFAIHPLRVESVAWVAERKDVLGTFFFMLTLGAYAIYVRKQNSPGRYLMVVAAFVMALLSKPTVVTLPFVLLLLDYWPLNRFEVPGPKWAGIPRRLVLEKIPLLALAAGACVATVLAADKGIATVANVPMVSRLGNAVVSYAVYLRQMVWPDGLAVLYPLPEKGNPIWVTAVSFLVLALITGGVLAFGRKRRWLVAGWLWYLGMLTPMIGIVQVGSFAHADRMTYLPQIGIYVVVTWLVAECRLNRVALAGIAAGVIVALMVCAAKQTTYWENGEALWNHTLDCTERNFIAHGHLGNVLRDKGQVDEAISEFEEALKIEPHAAIFHSNLGNALLQRGRVDEAIAHFRTALQIQPGEAEMHYNYGNAFLQKGSMDEAIAQYQAAVKIKPAYADARENLGVALFRKGKVDEAITEYQAAVKIQPSVADFHSNLGMALFEKGRIKETINQYEEALQIKPDNGVVQNSLAWLLATSPEVSLRNGNRAVELARQANDLTGGGNPIILRTLAAACAEAGHFADAVETAQRALPLAGAQSNARLAGQLQKEIKLYQAGRPYRLPESKH